MRTFINAWVLFTLVLFYFGPIRWEGQSDPLPAVVVLSCLGMFNLGASRKVAPSKRPYNFIPIPSDRRAAYTIMIVYLVLSMIYLSSITGKNPFLLSSYSLEFGRVYSEFGDNLKVRQRDSFVFISTILQALLYPFALVIFFVRFRTDRLLVLLFIGTKIASSMLRGTDKEIVDVIAMVGIAMFYHGLLTRRLFLILPAIPIFMSLFLLRRVGRFSDNLPICLPNSQACFDYGGNFSKMFGENAEILRIFLVNYISQGYEGLSRAIHVGFDFNFLVGHLPPVKRALCDYANVLCNIPDYQQKLILVGWDTSTRWPSAYTILANDVSFFGLPLLFLWFGNIFARADAAWRIYRDPHALVALFLIVYFFIYASANMQIAISLEWATATVLFLYIGSFRLRGSGWMR